MPCSGTQWRIIRVKNHPEGLLPGVKLKSLSPLKLDRIFRWYSGEPLEIAATFETGSIDAVFGLYTNLVDSWETIPFLEGGDNSFTLRITPIKPGFFYGKLVGSDDKGKTWKEIAGPYCQFFIDPPAAADLRLYTMIPTVSGTISDWRHKADQAADMGFNGIHLLPITLMGSSESPYAVADPFSIDPSYADPADRRSLHHQFSSFLDHVRKKGLHLCFDLVLNHTSFDGRIAGKHPDWLEQDPLEPDGLKRAGCWHKQDWIRWEDLVLINHYHPREETREKLWNFLLDYALLWGRYAAETDGLLRFDNLHSSKGDFILWLSGKVKEKYPNVLFLGEYFADNETTNRQTPRWQINLLTANAWERPFVPQLREYIRYIHQKAGSLRFLLAQSSHDTDVPANLYGTPDSTLVRHFIAACMGTGQSGFVQGVEDGVTRKINFIGRKGGYENPTPLRFSEGIRAINSLAAGFPELRERNNSMFVDNGHQSIIGVVRRASAASRDLLLLANLDIHNPQSWVYIPHQFPDKPEVLTMTELFSNSRVTLHPGEAVVLKPCDYRAYRLES